MKTVALTCMESKTVKLTEWVRTRDGERDGERDGVMGITGFDASVKQRFLRSVI